MVEILKCDYVKDRINGNLPICSENKEEFIKQYKLCLEQTKGVNGVVYVFKSEKMVPRLKGFNNILYIGETKNDVWNRYNVKNDTENFWHVYNHTIKNYGSITIDVYPTENHKGTEKNSLKIIFKNTKNSPQ